VPTLYITEPQATVRLAGRCLEVTVRPDDPTAAPVVRLKAELHRLELVALVGVVHVTRDALLADVGEGIGLAWFDSGGRFRPAWCPRRRVRAACGCGSSSRTTGKLLLRRTGVFTI
jgi:hypothetical protein